MTSNVTCFDNRLFGEKYYKTTHASGLTVLVYPKKLSTSYVMFSTHYGALERTFRRAGEAFVTVPDGVAHFLEHKLFEEEDGSDVFAKFASLGASANAFTSHEMTSYLFSTTDRLTDALAILLDFVTHPYFTEENVKKEQGIIGQEIGMCNDNPHNRLYYSLLGALYRRHNVRVDIAGTVESISEITPELLYRCYETFYNPSNMLLTVCGDTDIDTVMAVVDRVLPKTVAPVSVEREYPEEDEKIAQPYTEHYMSVSKPLFAFGCKDLASFKAPEEKVKHGILAEMLGKCYFSRSAAFFNRLYDDRLVSGEVQYSYDAMNSCAYLMISGESESPKLVYEKTLDLLKNISENLPSYEDFLRIKRVMYANFIRTFDSTEDLAYEMTSSYFHGTDLLTVGEIISSLTYEEFTRFASSFFEDKAFALSVIYPMAQKEGA